jgi:U32 family peptidase
MIMKLNSKQKKPELLVGVGNFSSTIAAVKNGADAIYFGVKGYNMRDLGTNFSEKDLGKLMKYLHSNNVKGYLALNTIIFEDELKRVDKIIKKAKQAKVDAIIFSDLGVLELIKKHGLEPHLSTQASVSNSVAVKTYKKLGVKRIVLARELNLEQIILVKKLAKKIGVEIECFIHGAMCISVSGRCFLSHELFGRSANRGKCLQPCRRAFFIDGDKPNYVEKDLMIQGDTILSPKDMKTIHFLDKIVDSGIDALKVEGRTKPSDYVATVTNCYREAIDSIFEKNYSKNKIACWDEKLAKVYNRGFSDGFWFSVPDGKDLTNVQGSLQTQKRLNVGRVEKYYAKIGVGEVRLFDTLSVEDKLLIEGKTTYLEQKLDSMQTNHKELKTAKKGKLVGIKFIERVRPNDLVYKLVENKKLVKNKKKTRID